MQKQTSAPTGIQRTAVYIRVSTDKQAKKGDSLDEQRETCLAYIRDHEDMVLQDIYIDDGVSGQKLDREEFNRLMANAQAGLIDRIIFTKLDRWFRSLRHYLNTQAVLEKAGIGWTAVSQAFYDTTTPQGRAFVSQSMIFAELEAQNDSERILSVFDYKYKHGEVLSGSTPLGYSIQDKHLVPDEDAPKALAVFRYYAETSSLNATVLYLERELGIVMCQANLKNLLRNEKYIGRMRDNESFCEPIIPKDLFEDVQRKLGMNVKSSQGHTYLFSGLVKCANCGHSMSGRIQNVVKHRNGTTFRYRYPFYLCRHAYPNKRCKNRKQVSEAVLERYLLDNVQALLAAHVADCESKAAPIVDAGRKRAAIEAKIKKLKDLYVNDLITLDEFKEDKAAYMKQLEELPDAEAPKQDLRTWKSIIEMDIRASYEARNREERRYFWRSFIREIQVDTEKNYTVLFF